MKLFVVIALFAFVAVQICVKSTNPHLASVVDYGLIKKDVAAPVPSPAAAEPAPPAPEVKSAVAEPAPSPSPETPAVEEKKP
ncbi:hypothetical protein RR46_03511 [Papilio xuthus]|uniref:Cuticular protein n=1 Tax=Papilio xuthus TaxID=66420 RepID=A0A194QES3_PAPXU|nr:hypothetical protein RR46_03511 [Papilio xuthus]